MAILVDKKFAEKANELKKLKVKKIIPKITVEFVEDENSFQNLKVVEKGGFSLPILFNSGDKLLIDFCDHYVGYLRF